MAPADGHGVLPRADPQGRGHHLGHRQRAARLQHRPVPDPRARHLGQDALGRPADERRRPVRDRRRRLGAQARAAAGQGELPALGQPRRVLRAGRVVRAPRRVRRQPRRPGPGRHPRPGDRHVPRERQVARPASSAASTTAARTSTWRSTGPRSWPRRPRTPTWRRPSSRSPRRWRPRSRQIVDELLAVQGSPADIGGYYRPDADKAAAVMRPSATFNEALASPVSETQAPDTPRPPDIGRRTLSPFGYAVCVAVPILIAALGFTLPALPLRQGTAGRRRPRSGS